MDRDQPEGPGQRPDHLQDGHPHHPHQAKRRRAGSSVSSPLSNANHLAEENRLGLETRIFVQRNHESSQ